MELWKEEINKSGMPSKNKIILNDYTSVRKKLVENINSTILYTEDGIIEGIISVDNPKNEVWLIIVKSSIQREGIGTILLNNIKRKKTQITTTINSSNEKALLFFYKNGFKKVEEKENEKTKQKDYILDWSKQKNKQITVAYFDAAALIIRGEPYGENTRKNPVAVANRTSTERGRCRMGLGCIHAAVFQGHHLRLPRH